MFVIKHTTDKTYLWGNRFFKTDLQVARTFKTVKDAEDHVIQWGMHDTAIIPMCKCGSIMSEGQALQNTLVYSADFVGDKGFHRGATCSAQGLAEMVSVWKCGACGHSFTK